MICSHDDSHTATDKQAKQDSDGASASDVRMDRVTRVKRQLRLGMYDEDEKLDAVLDDLLADVLDFDDAEPTPDSSEGPARVVNDR